MNYCLTISDGFVLGVCESDQPFKNGITKAERDNIFSLMLHKPTDPEGYQYKLRADNLEWELVKLPPVEPEPVTDEEALTRYANSITGANDQTLIEAAETLITEKIKEEY